MCVVMFTACFMLYSWWFHTCVVRVHGSCCHISDLWPSNTVSAGLRSRKMSGGQWEADRTFYHCLHKPRPTLPKLSSRPASRSFQCNYILRILHTYSILTCFTIYNSNLIMRICISSYKPYKSNNNWCRNSNWSKMMSVIVLVIFWVSNNLLKCVFFFVNIPILQTYFSLCLWIQFRVFKTAEKNSSHCFSSMLSAHISPAVIFLSLTTQYTLTHMYKYYSTHHVCLLCVCVTLTDCCRLYECNIVSLRNEWSFVVLIL